MSVRTFLLNQTIFTAAHPPIHVTELDEHRLTQDILATFLQTVRGDALGVATAHGQLGVLTAIAFATSSSVLHITLTKPSKKKAKSMKQADTQLLPPGREILRDRLLSHPDCKKLALDMYRVATALYSDYGLTITKAIDLQSMFTSPRTAPRTLFKALGGEHKLYREQTLDAFQGAAFEAASVENLSLRAWAACQAASVPRPAKEFLLTHPIDTTLHHPYDLHVLAKLVRDADRIRALKPIKVRNDVAAQFNRTQEALNVELTRFKTRLRMSHTQKLVVEMATKGNAAESFHGRVVQQEGKSARIQVNKAVSATAQIKNIYTIGREDPTYAEAERTDVVVAALQRRLALFDHTFMQKIFFSKGSAHVTSMKNKKTKRVAARPTIHFPDRPLNESQTDAVHRILSEESDDQICLIHGPPGTGKTTVIAACIKSFMAEPKDERGIWVVAQSNVAVKNIAEKLGSVSFWDFKVLVSKDFHFEWHEHLYERIEKNVIRSDEFADDHVGTGRLLLDSKVILCTISMLSHPRLGPSGFFRHVPVHTVIVDEASQIELGDYLPALGKFESIRKMVFIGDDKQLAPYGQDDIGDLASIFELDHLRKDAIFLDTQYRMPEPIGSFISKHVYGNQLKTQHTVSSRNACRLVDVQQGKETRNGNSWINVAEARAATAIAEKLHREGKAFRIITPYDAQRNYLEKELKGTNVPWENRCFNVDSFQGNEEDYIIISIVRSDKVGFLTNLRRTNVMLSRCKEGMIICTSRGFLEGKAASTLMGKLGREWGGGNWLSYRDALAGRF